MTRPIISRRIAVSAGFTVVTGWLVSGCTATQTANTKPATNVNPDYSQSLVGVTLPHAVDENGFLYFNDERALSLLWFTDIHGSEENLSRIMAWRGAHNDYIDDAICTGDMVYSNCENDFDYWTLNGAAATLTCIGNHDRNCGADGFDFSGFSMADAYERYLFPFIGYWGDTLHHNAGCTYYYKDYPLKKIRLVVVDSTEQDEDLEAQLAWFNATLEATRPLGYTVVVATHFMPPGADKLTCNFSTTEQDPISSTHARHVLPLAFVEAVDAYKQVGGIFAFWMCGHYHVDMVCHAEGHPDQLVIVQACAVCWDNFGDLYREEGTTSQDCFGYITIHPASNRVRLARIGASQTHAGNHRGHIVIDYNTMEIITSA